MADKTLYRGAIFYFKDDTRFANLPTNKNTELSSAEHQYVYLSDGALVVEDGIIKAAGDYSDIRKHYADVKQIHYTGKLITPGFIDTHLHATQNAAAAAYGEKLLEWLENYVFPAEQKFIDSKHASNEFTLLLDRLLANGTTTACAYGPLFLDANHVLFEELSKRNMRFITGNTMMDANSPKKLCLPTQENYDNATQLINKWHNQQRLSFCITPRFALSCSEALLELCGALKKEHSDCYIQTHLNENHAEISAVEKMFPWSKNYLDVYDHFGLVTDQSIFGHCLHMHDDELSLMQQKQSILAWCPVSNDFLGSGKLDWQRTIQHVKRITLGSDWGAGNTLSMFKVLDSAYKVAMQQNYKLPSMMRWYLATYGAARALNLQDKIGNFTPGKEADFIVIDPSATPLVNYRFQQVDDIFEQLFILMTLGDSRNIHATYINGKCAHQS